MDDDWLSESPAVANTTTYSSRGGYGSGGGGGGDGPKTCYKCKEEGHMSRECPSGGGGGGGGPRTCHKCNQEGHISRECPNGGGGGGGGGVCYKCNQSGHMARECTNEDIRPKKCNACQEEGHLSRDCPTRENQGPRACYKCKEEGHMSRECPNAPVGEQRRENDGNCHKCKQPGHMARECTNEQVLAEGEKPREKYEPAELGTGDDIFIERKELHSNSGINFQDYEKIPVTVTNFDGQVPKITSFDQFEIRDLIQSNINKCGYTKPTPIQVNATYVMMKGFDVMACAQTGSGKTCAYLMPIIDFLLKNANTIDQPGCSPTKPHALILAPTRELAIQIGREAHTYALGSALRTAVIYGGTTIFSQKNRVMNANILVGTPGRVKQFLNEGIVDFSSVNFFILDEADRMLDMGFMDDVKTITEKMTEKEMRITGMFSATFPDEVQKAARDFMRQYVFIAVGQVGGACKDVEQTFIQVDRKEKRTNLFQILDSCEKSEKILIFCNAKKSADLLATILCQKKYSSTSIHGDRLQSQRETALNEFARGVRQILVATAVAARGLDIPKVSTVINYDLPSEIDEYVHRIGRTGRVGNVGRAISFYDAQYDSNIAGPLADMLKKAGQPVPEWMSGSGFGGDFNTYGAVDMRGAQNGGAAADEEDAW